MTLCSQFCRFLVAHETCSVTCLLFTSFFPLFFYSLPFPDVQLELSVYMCVRVCVISESFYFYCLYKQILNEMDMDVIQLGDVKQSSVLIRTYEHSQTSIVLSTHTFRVCFDNLIFRVDSVSFYPSTFLPSNVILHMFCSHFLFAIYFCWVIL